MRKISIKVSICWLYSFNVVITKFLSTEDTTITFKSQICFYVACIPGIFSTDLWYREEEEAKIIKLSRLYLKLLFFLIDFICLSEVINSLINSLMHSFLPSILLSFIHSCFYVACVPGIFSWCVIVFVCPTTMLNSKIVKAVGWLIRGRGGIRKRKIFFLPSPSPMSFFCSIHTPSAVISTPPQSPWLIKSKMACHHGNFCLPQLKYPYIAACSFYITYIAKKPRSVRAAKMWGDWTSLLSGAPDKTTMLCRLAFTIQSKRISCSLVFYSPSFHPFPQFNMKLQIFNVIMLLRICLAVCPQFVKLFVSKLGRPRLFERLRSWQVGQPTCLFIKTQQQFYKETKFEAH